MALRATHCQGLSKLKGSRGDILRLPEILLPQNRCFHRKHWAKAWGIITGNNKTNLEVWTSVPPGEPEQEAGQMALEEAQVRGSKSLWQFGVSYFL